jgi:uncharacterized damage-inducible protein DinB
MTVTEIRTLFEYDEWATDRTMESVSSLPESKYQENLKSSHGGIHGTLAHVCWADALWLARWRGSPTPRSAVDEMPTLDSLKKQWKSYRADLGTFLGGLTDVRLATPLSYSDTKGNKHEEPLYQQMLHKINHSSYHRGQVVTMLRQIGHKPIGTDLIAFFRERKR